MKVTSCISSTWAVVRLVRPTAASAMTTAATARRRDAARHIPSVLATRLR